jgi:hypothetical protein
MADERLSLEEHELQFLSKSLGLAGLQYYEKTRSRWIDSVSIGGSRPASSPWWTPA